MAPLRDLIDFFCDRDGNATLPANSSSILENRLRRHDRLPGLQVNGLDGHGDAVPANRMHDQKVHGLRRTHAYGRREKHRRHRIAYRLHDPALRRHPADVRRSQKRIERAGRDGMERNGAPDPHPGRIHGPSRRWNSPARIRNCAPSSATNAARSSWAKALLPNNFLRRWRKAETSELTRTRSASQTTM